MMKITASRRLIVLFIITFLTLCISPSHTCRQILRSSLHRFTDVVLATLAEKWKLLFLGSSLVIAFVCIYTLIQMLQRRGSVKQILLNTLIVLTPWLISLKCLVKLYPLSEFKDTILDSVVEIIGSVNLVSFWLLIKESRAELDIVDRKLSYWVYQYVSVRCGLSVLIPCLKHLGFFSWFWVRALVWVILFVSEVTSIACVARLCLLVTVCNMTRMFCLYKGYKLAIWLEEIFIFVLGYLGFLDLSRGAWSVLYAAIILQMIVVSLLQQRYYRVEEAHRIAV